MTLAGNCPAPGHNRTFGPVAQMGERFVRNEQVRGSIPLGSTKAIRITGPAYIVGPKSFCGRFAKRRGVEDQ